MCRLHICASPIPQVCKLTVFSWTQTSVDITLSRGSSGFHILWTTWSAGTIQMDGLLTPIYNLQSLFSTKQPPPLIYHNSSTPTSGNVNTPNVVWTFNESPTINPTVGNLIRVCSTINHQNTIIQLFVIISTSPT